MGKKIKNKASDGKASALQRLARLVASKWGSILALAFYITILAGGVSLFCNSDNVLQWLAVGSLFFHSTHEIRRWINFLLA